MQKSNHINAGKVVLGVAGMIICAVAATRMIQEAINWLPKLSSEMPEMGAAIAMEVLCGACIIFYGAAAVKILCYTGRYISRFLPPQEKMTPKD